MQEATAAVANAKAAVDRASAELAYATNNLNRIKPLLAKQYVTVDQVDQATTLETTRQQALEQARSQLDLSQASLLSAKAQQMQAQATLEQSHHQVQQAAHAVTTLDPLTAQRSGRGAAIDTAQYNLDNCKFYAPFSARVTNLNISEGAYAHAGQEIFTLIDTRTWWAIANFRETQLRHIRPGMKADVYVLSRPTCDCRAWWIASALASRRTRTLWGASRRRVCPTCSAHLTGCIWLRAFRCGFASNPGRTRSFVWENPRWS